jgi:hypothetical protein
MSNLHRGHSMAASYQVSVYLATNLAKCNMSFCHHLVSVICHPFIFHILIFSENPQPNASFGSFGQAVSEEKIKM